MLWQVKLGAVVGCLLFSGVVKAEAPDRWRVTGKETTFVSKSVKQQPITFGFADCVRNDGVRGVLVSTYRVGAPPVRRVVRLEHLTEFSPGVTRVCYRSWISDRFDDFMGALEDGWDWAVDNLDQDFVKAVLEGVKNQLPLPIRALVEVMLFLLNRYGATFAETAQSEVGPEAVARLAISVRDANALLPNASVSERMALAYKSTLTPDKTGKLTTAFAQQAMNW